MKEYADSGETIRIFCEKNDLRLSTFSYWRKKLKDVDHGQGDPGFMKIESSTDIRREHLADIFRFTVDSSGSLEFSFCFRFEVFNREVQLCLR